MRAQLILRKALARGGRGEGSGYPWAGEMAGSSLSVSEPCWDCVSLFPAVPLLLPATVCPLPLPVSEGSVPILTWEVHMVPPACLLPDKCRALFGIA